MFGSAMLDLAIGMVFVFLLLSLICSAFNELLETWLKNRAGDLEKGIKELLGRDTGLVDKLYNHGLIFSLYRGKDYQEASAKKTLPSYIPSKDFANAVVALLGPQSGAIPSAADIRNSINAIPNQQVKSALLSLLNAAADDLQKFRAAVEGWFNSAMDRVSGWYKRRAHVVIFISAFAIAVAMNVDAISIARDLWTNQAQRDALVGAAQGYLNKHSSQSNPNPSPANAATAPSSQSQPASTTNPSPASPAASANPSSAPAQTQAAAAQTSAAKPAAANLDEGLAADIDLLRKTYLPIGWTRDYFDHLGCSPLLWLSALLGWLLTACAASLGAPFWFDVLGKIMVIRTSVKPGEKSGEVKSKA